MHEPTIIQRLLREKALGRYLNALERGDMAEVIRVLEQAERDPVLERMILEVHESYQAEEEFLVMVQEEQQMELDEGIHKSRLTGQQDEALDMEPVEPLRRKRGRQTRWLQVLAAALLIVAVVGGFLLLRNSHTSQNAATVPYQKWCAVTGDSSVLGVSKMIALAPDNAWAIGEPMAGAMSVFEHWDGAHWSVVNSATITNIAAGQVATRGVSVTLTDMVALSANDIWAVGFVHTLSGQNIPLGAYYTLVEHWDGTQWQQVASVNPYNNPSASAWNSLDVLSASSADNVWAAGLINSTVPAQASDYASISALVERWDGHAWNVLSLPGGLSKGFRPTSIAAVAPDDVWLTGGVIDGQGRTQSTRLLHWDGRNWSVVQLSSLFSQPAFTQNHLAGWFLNGVSATSAKSVWAFGGIRDAQHHTVFPLLLHWDGSQWSNVAAPLKEPGSFLTRVAAVNDPDNLWLVGLVTGQTLEALRSFLAHWDGHSWQQITLPAKSSDYITGVAVAGSKIWVLHTMLATNSNLASITTNC